MHAIGWSRGLDVTSGGTGGVSARRPGFALTRDVRESVQLMLACLRRPDLLDQTGSRPGGRPLKAGPG